MVRWITRLSLILVVFGWYGSSSAVAGVYADDLGKCLIAHTDEQDRIALIKWYFAAMSAHPAVRSFVTMTPEQRDEANRGMVELTSRLLTVDCRKESLAAIKYEGKSAFEGSFNLLGQISQKSLMSQEVVGSFQEMKKLFAENEQIQGLVKEAALPVENRPPPTALGAPQLTEAEQELVTDCRISSGDTVEAVKAAYGAPYAPQKLERITPAGTAYQYHFERYGTSVFFDNRLLVRGVRFDEPFRGTVQGVAIGDNSDQVRAAKGPPDRQFQGYGVVGSGGGSPVFTTAWVYAPERPSFIRYDILDGKVRSILASSCASEPSAR
jgi:hypothetical protein